MAKTDPQPDVLVLGEHPAAYLCAALLRHKTKLRVIQATLPNESWPDRLVLINPNLFSLHPILESLKRKLDLKTIYGVRFLADSPDTASEFRGKTAMAYVGSYKALRAAMMKVAEAEEVSLVVPKQFDIHSVDDKGVEVTLGKSRLHPKALVLAGLPTAAQQKILGLPDGWGPEVVHRYITFLKLPRRQGHAGQSSDRSHVVEPQRHPLLGLAAAGRKVLATGCRAADRVDQPHQAE